VGFVAASLLVPLCIFGLALAIVIITPPLRRLRARMQARAERAASRLEPLIHAINDDRCTGCDACINVCPTDVLELVSNKSRVARFDDCIQCEMCHAVCPTQALVMYPESKSPPPIFLPTLDEYYQTNVRGLYLIGEASGKPLCKNASNLGRAVIEHMRRMGLQAGAGGPSAIDVAIVGSGPGGLSAALSCVQLGYSYAVFEKENVPFSTVARYPKGKEVMAEPYDVRGLGLLPVWDAGKNEIVEHWKWLIGQVGVPIELSETVEHVAPSGGGFLVRTSRRQVAAQRVVLATGTRGKARKLGVPGEDSGQLSYLLDDPSLLAGRQVLVVGGGDSAAEAVLALHGAGARVTLSYRGKQLMRVNGRNRDRLERLLLQKRVSALFGSKVTQISPGRVALALAGGKATAIANDHVFALIGADPPVEWLRSLGVDYAWLPHMHTQPRSDELIDRLLGPGQPEVTAKNALQLIGRWASSPASGRRTRRDSNVIPLHGAHEEPDELRDYDEWSSRSNRRR
jgi:thioredoxin reductase/ferredoxin